jgi:hypothetical protein
MLPLVRRPASHVFEPPDLWQTRIDAAFGDRAQRIQGSTPARAVHRGRVPPALARRAGGPGRAQAHLGIIPRVSRGTGGFCRYRRGRKKNSNSRSRAWHFSCAAERNLQTPYEDQR